MGEWNVKTEQGDFTIHADGIKNGHWVFSKKYFKGAEKMLDGQYRLFLQGCNIVDIKEREELVGFDQKSDYSLGPLIKKEECES